MAATPFKVVSWSPDDPITDEQMDNMVSNDNWLRDNSVNGLYTGHGVRRKEGVKIASGLALIHSRKQPSALKRVEFNNFFLSVCRPVVTTGTVSGSQRMVWVTIDGLGKLHPDNRGFNAHVHVWASDKKNRRIKRNMYVAWHAVGY